MANLRSNEHGAEMQAGSECTLTEAIQGVAQQGRAQTVALQEKQQTLISLQATLSSIEEKGEEADQQLKSKVRQILVLQTEMEDLQWTLRDLASRSWSAYNQNTELRFQLEDEEDRSRSDMARYNTYRNKMEGHRAAMLHAESLTVAHKELEAQKEIDELREQIEALRNALPEKRELLLKEFENHTLIKKDIEIQNRRYEAIVKRFHCQLKKAQSCHWQISADICQMERQIEDLKTQLETP